LPVAEVLARSGVPLDQALVVLPAVTLDAAGVAAIGVGGRPAVDPGEAPLAAGPRSVVFRDSAGRALALGELTCDPAASGSVTAHPQVVFPWAVRVGGGAASRAHAADPVRTAEPEVR
ncbi:MAG: hypothetical protein HOP12_08645, partial [Candidatus Eisenbacteria bacterium]|nr:hypothetical protein [Candidatus Eisenbacteria bacterium]